MPEEPSGEGEIWAMAFLVGLWVVAVPFAVLMVVGGILNR